MKPESRYIDAQDHAICSDSFMITAADQRRLAKCLQEKLNLIENDHLLRIYLFLIKFLYTSHQWESANKIEPRRVITLSGALTMDDRSITIYDQIWLYNWLDVQDYCGIDESLIQPMKNLISFLGTDKHPNFSKEKYKETILKGIGY